MNRRNFLLGARSAISVLAIASVLKGRTLEPTFTELVTDLEPLHFSKLSNDFDADFAQVVSKAFVKAFETNRIVSRKVDTQFLRKP